SDPLTPAEQTALAVRPEAVTLRALHAPAHFDDITRALNELKIRELWPLCVRRAEARRLRRTRGKPFPAPQALAEAKAADAAVRAALPFTPTQGQEDVLASIAAALGGGGQFFGLLHGDVGSG